MEGSPEASFPAAFLQMLQTITADLLQRAGQTSDPDRPQSVSNLADLAINEAALLEGCCIAQAAACMLIASKQPSSASSSSSQQEHLLDLLMVALQQLRMILAVSKHGKLTGITASSLASVLNSVLTAQSTGGHSASDSNREPQQAHSTAQHAQHGSAQQAELAQSELKATLSEIMAAAGRVLKLAGAAMGKQGVAMGLVALLGGSRLGGMAASGALIDRPGWSQEAKDALQVCELPWLHVIAEGWKGLTIACAFSSSMSSSSTAAHQTGSVHCQKLHLLSNSGVPTATATGCSYWHCCCDVTVTVTITVTVTVTIMLLVTMLFICASPCLVVSSH